MISHFLRWLSHHGDDAQKKKNQIFYMFNIIKKFQCYTRLGIAGPCRIDTFLGARREATECFSECGRFLGGEITRFSYKFIALH